MNHSPETAGQIGPIEAPTLDAEALSAFCRRHHISKLSLFGSALRADFAPHSDLDFLVEFEEGMVPGLIRLAEMEIELTALVGRKADLRTAEDLSSYFRDRVVATARVQYAS